MEEDGLDDAFEDGPNEWVSFDAGEDVVDVVDDDKSAPMPPRAHAKAVSATRAVVDDDDASSSPSETARLRRRLEEAEANALRAMSALDAERGERERERARTRALLRAGGAFASGNDGKDVDDAMTSEDGAGWGTRMVSAYARAPPARPARGGRGGGWNGYDDGDGRESGEGDGPGRELNKFLVAGAFVIGIGAGVVFDTAVDLEPSNVASREILDRRTPSSELCMSNGASAMVFDQRVFLSLNPFNVYVAQPEVKPGCVLRRSNWGVLERGNVVDKKTEDVCKQHLNTFAFVGDLDKSPEVSCVYHSEDAENQFMKDPTKAVLGDGVVQSMRERVDAQSDMKAFR